MGKSWTWNFFRFSTKVWQGFNFRGSILANFVPRRRIFSHSPAHKFSSPSNAHCSYFFILFSPGDHVKRLFHSPIEIRLSPAEQKNSWNPGGQYIQKEGAGKMKKFHSSSTGFRYYSGCRRRCKIVQDAVCTKWPVSHWGEDNNFEGKGLDGLP